MCSPFFTKQQMFQVPAQKSLWFMIKRMWTFLIWNLLERYITEQPVEMLTDDPSPLLAKQAQDNTEASFVTIRP